LATVVAYAAILELGQMFIPGRESSLADWGASSVGAILGVTTALMIAIAIGKKPGLARRQNPKTSVPT
jgi:VanZ family protein